MAKELMEIGGFITSGAEIVNHDNTLSGNGTVDSPLGLNETVLWSGYVASGVINLSGSMNDYEYVDFHANQNAYGDIFRRKSGLTNYNFVACGGQVNVWLQMRYCSASDDGTKIAIVSAKNISFGNFATTTVGMTANNNFGDTLPLTKIVGINRKAQ